MRSVRQSSMVSASTTAAIPTSAVRYSLTPIADTFQDQFVRGGRSVIDPAGGVFYAELRPETSDDYRIWAIEIDTGNLVDSDPPLVNHSDPNKRQYPDFVAFVSEPLELALQATAVLTLCVLGWRRRRR